VSLNRRESYSHKKMNASDFFDCCLKNGPANTGDSGRLQESGYFWCGCIEFCIFADGGRKIAGSARTKVATDRAPGTRSRSGNSKLKQIFAGPCRRRN
jgi:hypothetical protein